MNLIVTSPFTRSRAARDAQWLLAGNNRYSKSDMPVKTYRGRIDGVYGVASGHAADRARFWLGYPKSKVNLGGRFGDQLYSYLLPRTHPRSKPLPTTYRLRRAARIRAEKRRLAEEAARSSVKAKALDIALDHVGTEEVPFGSNDTKFGRWYEFNRVAWCAIFVTYCLHHAGWKHRAKTALAYQWEWWARAGQYDLRITFNPEPGDIVVYHFSAGHVGFFKRWVNREAGVFEAVEGNTSVTSDDNGGKVMIRQRSTRSMRCVFVRVGG